MNWRVIYNQTDNINTQQTYGMQQYAARLPYTRFISLNEGNTPFYSLTKLAKQGGVKQLWLKDEGSNPTGSHKDRLSALIVTRAKHLGYSAVIAASSGNAGISLAAYARAARLRAIIVSTIHIPEKWASIITQLGGILVRKKTSYARWQYMEKLVMQRYAYPATNFILPPVGSNYIGVEGYKSIAYEIYAQFRTKMPDFILVPTSRGDVLWGICCGFQELYQTKQVRSLPKLIAVEPFPRLTRVLHEHADYREQFSGDAKEMLSIGGNTVTRQAVQALHETKGDAIAVTNVEAKRAQEAIFTAINIRVELSSAATIAAFTLMQKKQIFSYKDMVLVLATARENKIVSSQLLPSRSKL